MSEILKYKKALNFRANPRYLTRDFIVPLYTGTEPDILDDSDTQRESSVYKEFPNNMPIVSPKDIQNQPYEQLELADGGRVELKNNILNAYSSLKKNLGRNPSLAEIINKTGKTRKVILNNLEGKKLSQGRLLESGKTGTAASVEAFKSKTINKPTPTFYEGKLGVKWPNKETEDRYIKQIKGRYQYPAQSFEFNQKVKAGELLTDKALAKEFGINQASVERINKYIKNTEGLSYPRAEISEQEKDKRERRKVAEKKSSDPIYEKKIRGTKETQKSHMGDLYNVKVTPQTIGYAPQEINLALTGKVDPALKSIIEKQNKLYKNKPENYKQRIENLNVKGMDYAAQTEGYKVFEALDPKTGKRFVPITSPEKTIDPLGIAGETPLKNLTQEQKAQIELNRKAVMEAQAKIPASEKKRLVQMIGSIGCPTYAIGGRVNFSEGTDCYNKGLKALEEGNLTKPQLNVAARAIAEADQGAPLLKNILDKAGSGVKFTGKGVKELISIGAGPLGVAAGVLFETSSALPELQKGDWREAIRSTTLGFLPESIVGSRRTDLLRIAKTQEEKDAAQLLFDYQDKIDEANNIQGQIESLKNPEFTTSVEGYESDPTIKINQLENKLKNLDSFLILNEKKVNKVTPVIKKLSNELIESNVSNIIDPITKKSTVLGKIIGTTSATDKEKLSEDIQRTIYQEPEKEIETKPFEAPEIISPDDYLNEYRQYMSGGRVKLSEGGKGPKIGRRGFLGFLAGAAAAPFVAKFFKGKKTVQAAKVAGKVLPKVSGMPEWFSPLVSRIQKEGIDVSPKATRVEDIIKVKKLEVPAPDGKSNDIITMTEYPDGKIDIEANVYGGAFDSPFSLEYRPPRSDINLDTGAEIKSPGDFTVVEQRPRPESNNPGKIEIDYESMSVDDTISNLERLEGIGTGKRIHPRRVQQRTAARKYIEDNPHEDVVNRYPDGEIYYDQMKDEGLLDE